MISRLIPVAFGTRYRRILLAAASVVLFSSGVQALVPILFGRLVSLGELEASAGLYPSLLGIYCAVVFASGILAELRMLFLGLLDNVSFFRLSVETYRGAINSPYDYHLKEESGAIFERISLGSEAGSTLLQSGLGILLAYSVQIILSAIILVFFYGIAMGVVVIFCIASFVVLSFLATWRLKALQVKIAESQALSAGAAITGFESIETIKALGVESGLTLQYSQRLATYKAHVKSYLWVKFQAGLVSQIIVVGALAVGLAIPLLWHDVAGTRLEAIIVANLYILQLAIPLEEAVRSYFSVLEAQTNVQRLGPILSGGTTSNTRQEAERGAIELRNVGYYRGSSQILRNVSFTIPAGDLTLLIGPSGAGKSTVAHILVSLLEPTEGCVLVRRNTEAPISFGYVPQSVPLFNDTLRFNVDLGRGYPDQKIIDVLRRCSLEKLLLAADQSLDTILGDGGTRLSGGERQRLGLARALVAEPGILVLDEVTSGLDSETSGEILKEVVSLTTGATVVMVTHDLNIAQMSRHIIVLDEGQVLCEGNYANIRHEWPHVFAQVDENFR